jgi:hypothetical protein
MFYVPLVPLSLAALATLMLIIRRVDIRRESGGLVH